MKLYKFVFVMCVVGNFMFGSCAFADFSCQFDLRKGVIVANGHVRVVDKTKTLFQINDHTHVFSSGRFIEISTEQQQLMYAYSTGLESVIPEITLLAKEGIDLVVDNIIRAYSGLVGEGGKGMSEFHTSMKKAKKTVSEVYGYSSDYYYINPSKLEAESQEAESLQQQITTGFSNVSGILTAIATVDVPEQEARAESQLMLRKRAKSVCKTLALLNDIEKDIQQEISALRKLDVIIPLETK